MAFWHPVRGPARARAHEPEYLPVRDRVTAGRREAACTSRSDRPRTPHPAPARSAVHPAQSPVSRRPPCRPPRKHRRSRQPEGPVHTLPAAARRPRFAPAHATFRAGSRKPSAVPSCSSRSGRSREPCQANGRAGTCSVYPAVPCRPCDFLSRRRTRSEQNGEIGSGSQQVPPATVTRSSRGGRGKAGRLPAPSPGSPRARTRHARASLLDPSRSHASA